MEPLRKEPWGDAGLEPWLAAEGFDLAAALPLPGDVSPRRYARLTSRQGATAILATYPPEIAATCQRFLRTGELLARAGVRTPRVLAADCAAGRMLLEDLGPLTLGDRRDLPWGELASYFAHALDLARRIATLPAADVLGLNPPLAGELLRRELAQTWDLFLVPRELTGGGRLEAALAALLDELCANLAADPVAPCHRDFMVRNLMPLERPPELAVLDHQDLRLGPAAYDLASLLNDTIFPPPAVAEALLARAVPTPAERVRYHRAAAQRTLKAVGTYAGFARRGAERHLPLIPPTLGRCLEHLARTPEGAALAPELARAWSPVLEPPPH